MSWRAKIHVCEEVVTLIEIIQHFLVRYFEYDWDTADAVICEYFDMYVSPTGYKLTKEDFEDVVVHDGAWTMAVRIHYHSLGFSASEIPFEAGGLDLVNEPEEAC